MYVILIVSFCNSFPPVLCAIVCCVAEQGGDGAGERPAPGGPQGPGGDGGLVLCRGLWHLPHRLHGRQDQAEHSPGPEVLIGPLTADYRCPCCEVRCCE